MDDRLRTTDRPVTVRASDDGVVSPPRRLRPALIACLSVVGCLVSPAPSFAATDPCAATFSAIATALEAGNAQQALSYFTQSTRVTTAITQAAGQPGAASTLAQAFRTATLKQSLTSSTAIYSGTWQSAGNSYPVTIGVQINPTGCVVQAF